MPILDIYVSKAFQWYKKLFNLMNFDLWNYFLKIWKSIRIPIPKVGAHLGMCGFIPSFYTPESIKCDSWVSFLAHTFTSPCFGHEPNIKVATPDGESLVIESITNLRSNPSSMVHMESCVNQQGPPSKAKY